MVLTVRNKVRSDNSIFPLKRELTTLLNLKKVDKVFRHSCYDGLEDNTLSEGTPCRLSNVFCDLTDVTFGTLCRSNTIVTDIGPT